METGGGLPLICSKCRLTLITSDKICFFNNYSSGYHLCIQREFQNSFLNGANPTVSLVPQSDARKIRISTHEIICRECHKVVGNLNHAMTSEPMCCFRGKATTFMKNGEGLVGKWSTLRPYLTEIPEKNPSNFNDTETRETNASDSKPTSPVFIPGIKDITNCNLRELSRDKPRPYQIECFVSALQRNSIVYLPTGAGKTLIAAMMTSFMHKLNPSKTIFFVVDRVPLAFQQGSYLIEQTNLNVLIAYGEVADEIAMKKLRDYDVIAVTAQMLINWIHRGFLGIEDASLLVIDEVHHAVKSHPYSILIERYYKSTPLERRPLFLGLSASPVSGNAVSMYIELGRFCDLIECQVIMPFIFWDDLMETINRPAIQLHTVKETAEICKMTDAIAGHCKHIMKLVREALKLPHSLDLPSLHDAAQVRGLLRSLIDKAHQLKNEEAVGLLLHIQRILTAEELNTILGPAYARQYLEELFEKTVKSSIYAVPLGRLTEKIVEANSLSEKFAKLLLILSETRVAEATRAIVFVQTKRTARYLCKVLADNAEIDAKWLPSIFVGQSAGQIDGMSWADEQSPILQKFKAGQHKLLISTNVLQEGIDVPICDNVILFDQAWSLSSLIQSRGRARAKESRYILICNESEKKEYEELVATENNMFTVIVRSMAGDKTPRSLSALATLHLNAQASLSTGWSHNFGLDLIGYDSNKEMRTAFKAIRFQLHNLVESEEPWTVESFPIFSDLSLKNLSCAIEEDHVFFNQKLLAVTGEPLESMTLRIPEITKLLIAISEASSGDCFLTSYKVGKAFFSKAADKVMIMGENIHLGTLTSLTKFLRLRILPWIVKIVFDLGSEVIQLFVTTDDRIFRIDFSFTIIDTFIAIELGKPNNVTSMYLPLKSAAAYYYAHLDSTIEVKLTTMDLFEWYRATSREICEFANVDEASVFKIDMSLSKGVRDHLMNTLRRIESHGIHVLFGHISMTEHTDGLLCTDDLLNIAKNNQNVEFEYDIHLLLSNCASSLLYRTFAAEFVDFLCRIPSNLRRRVITEMIFRLTNNRFANVMAVAHASQELASQALQEFAELSYEASNLNNDDFGGTTSIKFLALTPTRLISQIPKKIICNRILRAFNPDYFLRVQFRDEDMQMISSIKSKASIKSFLNRISDFLNDGIVIGDRKYDFLAMSSSQLRNHGCWFVAPHVIGSPHDFSTVEEIHVNAEYIRKWCGDFSAIKNVAKYVARLGQSLSASIEVDNIRPHRIAMIPDYKVTTMVKDTPREYTYSDGVGMLSYDLAKHITIRMGLPSIPSAFQIRFGGCKGVLAIRPPSLPVEEDKEVWFRPSMKKFASSYNALEILNWSTYIPCYLNRQVIMILNGLGVPDEAFMALQDKMMKAMPNMLLDHRESISYLRQNLKVLPNSLLVSSKSFNFAADPFFRSLLLVVYSKQMVELLTRSRIFVPMGRILIGVIDETGTLNEDEIFVQVRMQITDAEAIERGIMHPGRKDCFKVISEVAIAKNPCMHPGDVRRLRAVDNQFLEKYHYDCVVFPRKGSRPITDMCSGSDLDGDLYFVTWDPSLLPPTMVEPMDYTSPPAKEVEQVTMNDIREFLASFIANDQLGIIANDHVAHADTKPDGVKDPICINLAYIFSLAVDFPKTGIIPAFPKEGRPTSWPDFMQKHGVPLHISQRIIGKMFRKVKSIIYPNVDFIVRKIAVDDSFLVPGYEKYLVSARTTYQSYCDIVNGALLLCGVRSEARVFSGSQIESYLTWKEDVRGSTEILERKLSEIYTTFYRKFCEQVPPNELVAKASAWYYVTYSDPIQPSSLSGPILSFPWIVADHLMAGRALQNSKDASLDSVEILGHQMVQWTRDCIKNDINHNLVERLNFFTLLKDHLTSIIGEGVAIELSGSTLGLICATGSDINIFVNVSEEELMGKIFAGLCETFSIIKKPGLYLEHRGSPVAFTIFCNPNWHSPAVRLRSLTYSNASNFAILTIILKWARTRYLVRSTTKHSGKLSALALSLLVLEIIGKTNDMIDFKQLNEANEEAANIHDISKQLGSFDQGDICDLGDRFLKILQFFAFESESQISKRIPSNVQVNEFGIEHLRDYSFQAYHLVAQTLDISNLWEMSHSPQMEGKNVSVGRRRPKLIKKHGASKSVFVEGSSVLIFEGSRNSNDSVDFDMYQRSRRPQHYATQCYVPVLKHPANFNPLNTKEFLYQEYFCHAFRQFDLARRIDDGKEFGPIKAAIKFGYLYVTNLARLFLEDGTFANVGRVQEALKLGYKSAGDVSSEKCFRRKSSGFDISFAKKGDCEDAQDSLSSAKPPLPTPQELLEKSMELAESESIALNAVAKKKSRLSAMNGSFEPFINDANQVREFLIGSGLYCAEEVSGYAVSITLYNSLVDENCDFQVIYDDNMQLLRMRYRPLRWMNIDVRGDGDDESDYRFVLSSAKPVDIKSAVDDASDDVTDLIKKGIVTIGNDRDNPQATLLVAEEFRNCEHILVRSNHTEKFRFCSPRHIQEFLDSYPAFESTPIPLLERLQVFISHVTEYTTHDPNSGIFQDIRDKQEMEVVFALDWEELAGDGDIVLQLVPLMWKIAHLFKHLNSNKD